MYTHQIGRGLGSRGRDFQIIRTVIGGDEGKRLNKMRWSVKHKKLMVVEMGLQTWTRIRLCNFMAR